MKVYEPLNLAMPLAKRLGEIIVEKGDIPDGEDVRKILIEMGLEESCLERGMGVYRSRNVVAILFTRGELTVVDLISSSGELSDAMEVIAYLDRELNSFIVEIVPANDLQYEGNIGIEPVIIDAETLELKSNPVLGHFEGGEDGLFLIIDRETYERWKASGSITTCPVCGGELSWKGDESYCNECGYGVRVKG
jgi:hypothetical protein